MSEKRSDKEKKAREDVFALEHSIAHLLHRAQQVGADKFADRNHPVSLRQFGVLAAIGAHPGANQRDLVRAASIDRSTLADMLKRLELIGLVEKTASETDARANCIALTLLGREVLIAGADDARKADQAVLNAMPKSKRKAFEEALVRMARLLDEAAEVAARAEKKRRKEAGKARKAEAKRKARVAAK